MVELLDGYTNQVVARYDWRSPPRELLNVTGDFVILYFYSDRTNQAQGFALLYQGIIWANGEGGQQVCLSITKIFCESLKKNLHKVMTGCTSTTD